MKKSLISVIIVFVCISCGTSKKIDNKDIQLTFIDDYIIPENLEIGGTKVGGLSGIEYHNGKYYLVCDHPGNPRFYEATINFDQKKIDTVIISEVLTLNKSSGFLKELTLDLESIRYDVEENEFVLSSEGSIKNNKDPSFFRITPDGEYVSHYSLPDYFMAKGDQMPRNNGVFEGLTESFNKDGYWVGIELPLKKDGSKPKLFPTKSPVRITYFDKKSREATNQFVMQLENITKIPWLYFAVNGLTELLEYAPKQFLILERTFSAGHGTNGYSVRIFDVDARNASNTLAISNLKKENFFPASKTLVFDFKAIRKHLKENIIDNMEGMTFGPDLPNGNKTLLLVSDNNFNALGRQISQIIILELEIK